METPQCLIQVQYLNPFYKRTVYSQEIFGLSRISSKTREQLTIVL